MIELIGKHLVTREGNKRRTAKYQATELAIGNLLEIRGKLLQSIGFDRIIPRPFDFITAIEGLGKYMKTFGPYITAYDQINTFKEALATYIINVFIIALRPKSFLEFYKGKNTFYKNKDLTIENRGKIEDTLIKEYVKNAINLDKIFWEFRKLPIIQKGLKCNSKNAYDENDPRHSFYEFDDIEVYNELRKVCESLNPYIFKELENVRIGEIPISISDRLRTLQNKPSSNSIIKEPTKKSIFF